MEIILSLTVGVLVATQALNLLLVPWLGHAGLALSIGLGALANAAMLLRGLRRSGAYRPQPGWVGFAVRVILASVVMGAALHAASVSVDWLAMQPRWALRAGWLAAVIAAAAALYLGLLAASGLRLRALLRRG